MIYSIRRIYEGIEIEFLNESTKTRNGYINHTKVFENGKFIAESKIKYKYADFSESDRPAEMYEFQNTMIDALYKIAMKKAKENDIKAMEFYKRIYRTL